MTAHPETTLKDLGERVRAFRRDKELTLRVLAERTGISERFLSDVECGRGNVSVSRLWAIARALEVDAGALMGAEGREEPRLRTLGATLARLSGEELDEVERWVQGRFGARSERRVLALLGLRGAGKSSAGAAAARKLGWPFIELDARVEAAAGLSLAEIFALHGEAYYRRLELKELQEVLAGHRRAVLATGGGIVQSAEAFSLLDRSCVTVWLKANPEDHWERVVGQGDVRPMRGRRQARSELQALLHARKPLYSRAHHILDTAGLTTREVANALREIGGAL